MKKVITTPNSKVIIISENINFRNNLASKLRLENYDVELATGGFHLLHLLEKDNNKTLIICNGDMPDMPALEMISLARVVRTKLELPIIYISKEAPDNDIVSLIQTGNIDYLIQSTNFNSIVERAQKYFHQMKQNAA
ncbi:MAG: response regulator [Bdellovibrionales bacterium]|nr:response regulator [Bdellovibrionales bacterium]